MWLDLTDGTLKRKQTGLGILAGVRELKISSTVNVLRRMREQMLAQLTSLSLQGLSWRLRSALNAISLDSDDPVEV